MITVYLVIIIMAVVLTAFFTSAEMACTTVNRMKLKDLIDKKNVRAIELNKFLGEGLYLGVTLVGTNIAVVIASVLTTRIFADLFGMPVAPLLSTLVLVPITLIFAEIVPKIIARQLSLQVALGVIGPLKMFHKIFYPITRAVDKTASFILSPFRGKEEHWDLKVTKRDLINMLELGHEAGEVERDELELIHKVLDFGSINIEKIMVPIYRVSSLSSDDTEENLRRLVSLTGYSRIPVYEGNKNNIIGIINIYDFLFKIEDTEEPSKLIDHIREMVLLNRTDGLDIALARLRHKKQPMGIVVDDAGAVVGIVTIEDILEELVGEIEDEG